MHRCWRQGISPSASMTIATIANLVSWTHQCERKKKRGLFFHVCLMDSDILSNTQYKNGQIFLIADHGCFLHVLKQSFVLILCRYLSSYGTYDWFLIIILAAGIMIKWLSCYCLASTIHQHSSLQHVLVNFDNFALSFIVFIDFLCHHSTFLSIP